MPVAASLPRLTKSAAGACLSERTAHSLRHIARAFVEHAIEVVVYPRRTSSADMQQIGDAVRGVGGGRRCRSGSSDARPARGSDDGGWRSAFSQWPILSQRSRAAGGEAGGAGGRRWPAVQPDMSSFCSVSARCAACGVCNVQRVLCSVCVARLNVALWLLLNVRGITSREGAYGHALARQGADDMYRTRRGTPFLPRRWCQRGIYRRRRRRQRHRGVGARARGGWHARYARRRACRRQREAATSVARRQRAGTMPCAKIQPGYHVCRYVNTETVTSASAGEKGQQSST